MELGSACDAIAASPEGILTSGTHVSMSMSLGQICLADAESADAAIMRAPACAL